MQLLRDPIWISIIVSTFSVIIPLITSVIIYRKQQHRKSLSYQLLSNIPLFNAGTQYQGRVQILVNGNALDDANVLILRISNTGNVPILPSDFLNPCKFNFGNRATVLDAEVIEAIPSTIVATVTKSSDSIILEPLLLNGKDSIKLKVLLTRFDGDIDVSARIVGIKQVQGSNKVKSWSVRIAYSAILISCVMAGVIALLAALELGILALFAVIAAIIPLLFGIILIFVLFLLNRNH